MDSIPVVLEHYLAQYPNEIEALQRLRELVDETPNAADLIARTNFRGHVTASGFVLSADGTATLLVHHRALGIYVQPGGHMDMTDASPLAGAFREVREETGLMDVRRVFVFDDPAVPFDIDSHYIPPNTKRREPDHWHHDFRYVFQCTTDASLELSTDEVIEARWVRLEALETYPTMERVAEKLKAYRENLR